MTELRKLSPPALSAAMRGGTASWGRWANAEEHVRYMEPTVPHLRRRCSCGCWRRAAYTGKANGMALMNGCEFFVRRWVRDGTRVFAELRP